MKKEIKGGAKLSILVAEDNVVSQQVAAALLATMGHKVTICNNGREAVQAVIDGDFDLLLMDIVMPVLDGVAATLEIRALPDRRKAAIPILAISGNVSPQDLARYHAAGVDDVLGKPLRTEQLQAFLDSMSAPVAEAVPSGLLDEVHIAALRDAVSPQKLVELYDLARDSLMVSAVALLRGWRHNNLDEVKSAAHRLAGVARNFGCLALGECAARIEDAAKLGQDSRDAQAEFERLLASSLAAMPGATSLSV